MPLGIKLLLGFTVIAGSLLVGFLAYDQQGADLENIKERWDCIDCRQQLREED